MSTQRFELKLFLEALITRIAIFVADFFKMKKTFGFSQACEYYVVKYLSWIPTIKRQISSETQKVTNVEKIPRTNQSTPD